MAAWEADAEVVTEHAAAVLAADGGRALRAVAVTGGARPANLFCRSPCGARLDHWQFQLPPLPAPLLNAIGAGDTVAGVFLHLHVARGLPAEAALGHALAAGSASCATLAGGVWDARLAEALARGVTLRRRALHLPPAAA